MDLFTEICDGCYKVADIVFVAIVILLFSPVIVVAAILAFPFLVFIGAINTARRSREEKGSY